MTKDLTEQWKNGELEQGYYYTRYTPSVGKPFVEIELKNYLIDLAKVRDADTVEVLAPVPSYEQWEKLNWYTGNGVEENQELKMENAKLKGLLKECRDEIASIDYDSPVNEREQNELLAKIDEVLK